MRYEGSLLTSLAELRSIEEQRIASERAAVIAAEAARASERALAEQQAREAEEARLVAAREAELALVRERERAEREARMHVEATEAAARARHQAELEAERLAQEVVLRRAAVAKQRPTWMLAVTGVAIACAIGLGAYAVHRQAESVAATDARHAAELEKARAVASAEEAQRQMDDMATQLAVLDGKVRLALDDIGRADTAAKAAAAKASFLRLQQEAADLRARKQRLEDERLRKERRDGKHMDEKCLHNAVC